LVLEICGESISIPNGIADWCHENPDNKTEFDGMIESMIWAIQKSHKPKCDTTSEKNDDWLTNLLTAYKDILNGK
jgi:hypothetical protein